MDLPLVELEPNMPGDPAKAAEVLMEQLVSPLQQIDVWDERMSKEAKFFMSRLNHSSLYDSKDLNRPTVAKD